MKTLFEFKVTNFEDPAKNFTISTTEDLVTTFKGKDKEGKDLTSSFTVEKENLPILRNGIQERLFEETEEDADENSAAYYWTMKYKLDGFNMYYDGWVMADENAKNVLNEVKNTAKKLEQVNPNIKGNLNQVLDLVDESRIFNS